MSFAPRDDAVAMLDAGEVDLAVGGTHPDPPGVRGTVRVHHPARAPGGERPPPDLDGFLALSHLLVSPENERFGHVDAALAERGLKRRLALTLPHMHAAPRLIARSDMVAVLMRGVVLASGHADGLTVVDPPVDLDPVQFVLSWHRRNDAHPAQRWFREAISAMSEQARHSSRRFAGPAVDVVRRERAAPPTARSLQRRSIEPPVQQRAARSASTWPASHAIQARQAPPGSRHGTGRMAR